MGSDQTLGKESKEKPRDTETVGRKEKANLSGCDLFFFLKKGCYKILSAVMYISLRNKSEEPSIKDSMKEQRLFWD